MTNAAATKTLAIGTKIEFRVRVTGGKHETVDNAEIAGPCINGKYHVLVSRVIAQTVKASDITVVS